MLRSTTSADKAASSSSVQRCALSVISLSAETLVKAGVLKACPPYFGVVLLLFACGPETAPVKVHFTGVAQGTFYNITYLDPEQRNLQVAVDSIFRVLDLSLSTYVDSSVVSRVNRSEAGVTPDEHFMNVFRRSAEISALTEGAFDATVGPVVNAWGFGPQEHAAADTAAIDSLLQFVGYTKVRLEELPGANTRIVKESDGVMLDFNAIAQGYSVDLLCAFIESRGIGNYLVEVGGEVRGKGTSDRGEHWKVGIDRPEEDAGTRQIQAVIRLNNRALATSGNYRKFYEEGGAKFAHTIAPSTGRPAGHSLLSATVLAADCMTADALATAFMVIGTEKTKQFLGQHPEFDAFLIYVNTDGQWETFSSAGLKDQLTTNY